MNQTPTVLFIQTWFWSINGKTLKQSFSFWQLLLLVGAKLEYIITKLAKNVAESVSGQGVAQPVKPSDELFWFHNPTLVLYLIHFILFQNSFEIAFLFWVWVSKHIFSDKKGKKMISWNFNWNPKLWSTHSAVYVWIQILYYGKIGFHYPQNNCWVRIKKERIITFSLLFLAFDHMYLFTSLLLQGNCSSSLQLQYISIVCSCHTGNLYWCTDTHYQLKTPLMTIYLRLSFKVVLFLECRWVAGLNKTCLMNIYNSISWIGQNQGESHHCIPCLKNQWRAFVSQRNQLHQFSWNLLIQTGLKYPFLNCSSCKVVNGG